MIERNKVLFLLCLSPIFGTYVPLSERSVKNSPIMGLFPVDQFLTPRSEDNIPLDIPEAFAHRLESEYNDFPIRATFNRSDLMQAVSYMVSKKHELRSSPDYSHIPNLSISLKPHLKQLDEFLSESQKLSKDEKADKYAAIKPTLDEIISKVNEAIQEAIKETVYSSDDIEAAYAKLLQLGDTLDLMSNELSREINFDSQMLESDARKDLYATLIELRNALARDEDPMPALMATRSNLGMVYRISFPDYERARTEAHYVLKLVRQKMGWNNNHVDEAIEDAKRLVEEMYQIKINNWKDIIPEIPWASIKGIRVELDEADRAKNKRLIPNEPCSLIDVDYSKDKLWTFNLERSLKLEWIKLCEIFETVYEQKPTEQSEELYRLLCALGDFELINESRQFLFFPWFDPMTYTRGCRKLHTGLHIFKSAIYSPSIKSFSFDVMHSVGEHIQNSKNKEVSKMSILNEAILPMFVNNLNNEGNPVFFTYANDGNDVIPGGLKTCVTIDRWNQKTFFGLLREIQFKEFSIGKRVRTKHELSIIKRMENHEIAFMLEALDYHYDIIQLSVLRRFLYESETNSGGKSTASTASTKSISSNESDESIKSTESNDSQAT